MKKRALLSVSDKTGLNDLAKELIGLGYELISTGGTKKSLEEAGIQVIGVEDVTQAKEMLDGRVKTLHPAIHGGLLAIRSNPDHMAQIQSAGITPIDLVIVNLYPFKKTISRPDFTAEEAIENIDIGGPSMLRSAAKNHHDVTVICDPADYSVLLEQLHAQSETTLAFRQAMAAKVFRQTASYDAMIAEYMTDLVGEENPEKFTATFELKQTLRYGENPHQKAWFYSTPFAEENALSSCVQLHGKELSYNNIQDANAALQLLAEFDRPTAIGLKHTNPCGVGTADTLSEAWQKAYESDPISIFGGIVAFNREVTLDIAEPLSNIFLEIVLAPSYTPEALECLSKKKNIRLMTTDSSPARKFAKQFVRISGGLLVQDRDSISADLNKCTVVTTTQPTAAQSQDALFGEKVCKHVKSNAIVIVKDGATLGIGAGQMNRVGSAEIALKQAGKKAIGATMASDAFFPMSDTVELAAQYGIAMIIQPGGSIKDKDSIEECNKQGIAMVVTGERHFKH